MAATLTSIEFWEWFLKIGLIYGLGFVAIAGLLVLVFTGAFLGGRAVIRLIDSVREKWLPELVSGHLTFLEHTKTTTAATRDAVTKLTESYGASMDNHSKTHRALASIAKAQQEGDVCDEARKYLDDAIRELQ